MGVPQSKVAQPLQSPSDSVSVTFQYGSINGSMEADAPSHEALIIGTSLGGRMSAVRRFFCLLTTFDLLFTVFLWFVCAMLSGKKAKNALEDEVVYYSIESSLFDIVLVSAFRFVLILLTYAFFLLAHWWMIAITTSCSGAFIIAKVFLYHWADQSNPLVTVFLLMCSFVISWGEAWFLDFRVMPYEDKARLLLARQVNERTAVIPRPRSSSPSPSDVECFYSPHGSETESDNEDCNAITIPVLTLEDLACKRRAEEALEQALNLIHADNWRTEKIVGHDIIQSLKTPKFGKLFKFVGKIQASASALVDEFIQNCESTSWNPTVKRVQRLHMIDENTDVVYVMANEAAGGLVSCRDFINLRIWQKRGNVHVIGLVSSDSSEHSQPLPKGVIRGEQGPSVYIFTPCADNSSYCQIQWLVNTSLKGWIPQYVIDQAMSGVMLDYIYALRKLAATRTQAA